MVADRRALLSSPILDTYIVMVMIDHITLSEPIRVCTHTEDIVSQGETWYGCQVLVTLPTRNNNLRTAELTVQNVDSRIGKAAQVIHTPCTVYLSLCKAEEPDIIEIEYPPMRLTDIAGTAISITADLASPINRDEPYPKIRANKSNAPGIFTDVIAEY